jgi:hypothetical protein
MELKPAASRTSAAGPADWFTGQVWMDELGALPSAGIRTLRVTFSPGARTAYAGAVSGRPSPGKDESWAVTVRSARWPYSPRSCGGRGRQRG